MKTIEERAKEYSGNYPPFYQSKIAYDAYIEGATEQKAIDDAILKAKIVGAKREGRVEEAQFREVLVKRERDKLIDKAIDVIENLPQGFFMTRQIIIDALIEAMEE